MRLENKLMNEEFSHELFGLVKVKALGRNR